MREPKPASHCPKMANIDARHFSNFMRQAVLPDSNLGPPTWLPLAFLFAVIRVV